MPKDKDLKRLARQRMEKTGESYTTARAQILAKRSVAGERLTEPELAELAGISTAAVTKATGHDWGWWLDRLDADGFRDQKHREITRFVGSTFEISAWWTQSVVIGYERIVGLREIGQSREGSYSANKSKTFPVPVERLYTAFSEGSQRAEWLPEIEWSVRTETAPRSIRLGWPDGCPVDLWFTAKGEAKSSVQVQHRKLAAKDDIDRAKAEWTERFAALAHYLSSVS